jgi:hypothetical protein
MRKIATIAAMALGWAATVPAAACSEAPDGEAPRAAAESVSGADLLADEGRPVSNLPYARGRTFRTLDEYLAHLERQGAIDLPYWRQVAPGLYERVTTRMPRGAPERATRAELMERFGFTR